MSPRISLMTLHGPFPDQAARNKRLCMVDLRFILGAEAPLIEIFSSFQSRRPMYVPKEMVGMCSGQKNEMHPMH